MGRLLLVRHGETEFNNSKRFAGCIDVNLNSTGIWQVRKLKNRLRDMSIDCIFCSDLKRTRDTADILAEDRKIQIEFFPELREMNYGEAEGLSFSEIEERFPSVARELIACDDEIRFPGGECFSDLKERIAAFIAKAIDRRSDRTILVVSHSGPLRVLLCLLLKADIALWWRLHLDNASLSIIDTYDGINILRLLNDTSHLKDLI